MQNLVKKHNQLDITKIFDLSKSYPEYKKSELQKNLINFLKKYGKHFIIKYNKIKIDVVMEKAKLPTGDFFFRISYDIPKRTTVLVPFIIDFIDPVTGENNNNTNIVNIQKTDILSGSSIIKICLKINKILGAEKTSLKDYSKIICNKTNEMLDLSYIKLLEKKMTFYMNYGFDFDVNYNTDYIYRIKNIKQLRREIHRLIYNIRNIQTKNIIKEYEKMIILLNLVIKNNDEKNLKIIFDQSDPTNPNLVIHGENPNIKALINEANDILKILYKYKNINLLYKILVKLFKESCDEYVILDKYLIRNTRLQLIYKKNIINRNYIKDFLYLKSYRHEYLYTYKF